MLLWDFSHQTACSQKVYFNIAQLPSCHDRYMGYSKILLKREGILCLKSHCTVIAVIADNINSINTLRYTNI